jgi:hypothetical protein
MNEGVNYYTRSEDKDREGWGGRKGKCVQLQNKVHQRTEIRATLCIEYKIFPTLRKNIKLPPQGI